MINEVRKEVEALLLNEKSGHGMEHVNRVFDLAMELADKEHADKEEVGLIALLHDVDDYKLFGEESHRNLTNAKKIMDAVLVDKNMQVRVLDALKGIGYSKALLGIRPQTLEGKIVSDADMCDALGAIGIIRVHSYGMHIQRPFFLKNIFPDDELGVEHHLKGNSSTVNFIVATLLNYKYEMLTEHGKKEAEKREKVIIDFLFAYFKEEKAYDWIAYLENYLKKLEESYSKHK